MLKSFVFMKQKNGKRLTRHFILQINKTTQPLSFRECAW